MTCAFCQLPVPPSSVPGAGDVPAYCCYGCRFAAEITQARGDTGQLSWLFARLGVAIFLTMSLMMFSMFGYRQQIAAGQGVAATEISSQLGGLMQYLSLLFATPVFLLLGFPVFAHAVDQTRRRVASTDALIILGVAAAFLYSYLATLTGRGETYYETACAILVFVTLGRWLEARGRLRASDAIAALQRLLPDRIAVERDGCNIEIAAAEVRVGDRLRILAGQRIAADGRILTGRAAVDEQLVTGESTPVEKGPGDQVRTGTLNLDGTLHIEVTSDAAASTLARLTALLDAARRSRGRYHRLADRIAAVFLPVTIVVAIVAAVLGYHRGGWSAAILSPLAVLLIACPCALGISTPAAIWVALGAAASRRIIIRDAETLERLSDVQTICFDKTGTLTSPDARVAEFILAEGEDESVVRRRAAAVAGHSTHVLCLAVLDYLDESSPSDAPLCESSTIPGRGVLADMDGVEIVLGSAALMADRGLRMTDTLQRHVERLLESAGPIMLIGWQDRVRGLFAFDESLRDDATSAMAELRRMKIELCVLTGDHVARGRRLAQRLKVPVHAALLPEEKVRHVFELRNRGRSVAVIGDGLNDAPAMASADVGIAMGCGADVTRDSAAVCLAGDDLAAIPWLLRLGRRTVRTIQLNLLWGFAYNSVGMMLAATGRLSPLFAAGAMVCSSLFVVANSLRLAKEQPRLNLVAHHIQHAPAAPMVKEAAI